MVGCMVLGFLSHELNLVTLWTQEQELQVQLRDGRSFVRGQLVCLEEQAEGGAALVFGNADHVPLEEVQRFLGCIALRESSGEEGAARAAEKRETSTQTPHHERAPTKKQGDAATQTPHDGPSALFTEEQAPPGGKQKIKSNKFKGVVDTFRVQLEELYNILDSSQLHFVRCFKPNDAKAKDTYARRGSNQPRTRAAL